MYIVHLSRCVLDPVGVGQWRKSRNMQTRKAGTENLRLSEHSLELVSVFIEANNIGPHTESTDLIL
jgi:hypothetical protein